MNGEKKHSNGLLWTLTIVLVIIGIGIVARRLLFLNDLYKAGQYIAPVSSRSPVPDTGFAEHPLITLIHIIPGLLFMLLAPLQFAKTIRLKYPKFRRYSWYIIFACGLVIGVTALVMGFTMAVGGIIETLAVAVYGVLFLFSLVKAAMNLYGNPPLHREWMIRTLAIGLAVSTTRPIVVLFFATSKLTGLTVQQYFGPAFWIAFTLHLIIAEIWIRRTREKRLSYHVFEK
jgi:hypothetical protein